MFSILPCKDADKLSGFPEGTTLLIYKDGDVQRGHIAYRRYMSALEILSVDTGVDYEADGDLISSAELKDALSTLTPPDAQIILLSIIGGFTSYELGVIYNMTPGAVRTRQKRAIEKLKNILS